MIDNLHKYIYCVMSRCKWKEITLKTKSCKIEAVLLDERTL